MRHILFDFFKLLLRFQVNLPYLSNFVEHPFTSVVFYRLFHTHLVCVILVAPSLVD